MELTAVSDDMLQEMGVLRLRIALMERAVTDQVQLPDWLCMEVGKLHLETVLLRRELTAAHRQVQQAEEAAHQADRTGDPEILQPRRDLALAQEDRDSQWKVCPSTADED